MKNIDNILDNLIGQEEIVDNGTDEIVIPKKCSLCKSSMICSILPVFANLSKIKIFASIEQCPYFQSIKNEN